MIELDRESDLPLYRQLADVLRARITSGYYPPGTQLPPERHLEQETSTHRITVRKALDVLRGEGLIEARRPVGTFVREAPGEHTVDLPWGSVVRTRMPTPEERESLDLGSGVPVFAVEVDGETALYAGDRCVLRAGRPPGGAR